MASCTLLITYMHVISSRVPNVLLMSVERLRQNVLLALVDILTVLFYKQACHEWLVIRSVIQRYF